MHSYDFRLRFNMAESYRIGSDLDGFDLLTPQTSENIRLRSGGMGTPVKNHDNAAILGGSFASEDEARVAAEKSKRALLYWAVEHRVGIDFGDGKQRSYATKEGLEWWQKKCGCPCRNDILGIDVYEHEENIKFVSCTANPTLMKSPNILITTFQHEYLKNRQLTEKQVLASEIYASSFFDISARSRFITLVPAVEALIEQRKYSADVQEMVDKFVEIAHQTTIDNTTKNSIIGRLEDFKRQSIRQAGRELISHLLPDQTFDGKSAIDFFKLCYDTRSQILHDGEIADKSVNVLELANNMDVFVHKLLLASFNTAPQ